MFLLIDHVINDKRMFKSQFILIEQILFKQILLILYLPVYCTIKDVEL